MFDIWILLTWVTQTSHGKCLFVCVLFYNKAVLQYLRCAMLQDCTVIKIIHVTAKSVATRKVLAKCLKS